MSEAERDGYITQHFAALAQDSTIVPVYHRPTCAPPYVVVGPWATWAAREIVCAEAVLKEWGTQGQALPVILLNETLFRAAVVSLVGENNKVVCVYKRNGDAVTEAMRITASTLVEFEDELGTEAHATQLPATAAVTAVPIDASGVRVAAAVVTSSQRRFFVAQFTDSFHLPLLDCLLTQCGVCELYLPFNANKEVTESLTALCQRLNITLTGRPQSDFSFNANEKARLENLLFIKGDILFLDGARECQPSLGAALSSLPPTTSGGCFRLQLVQPRSLMTLDSTAVEALNLVSRGERRGTIANSIYSWLNRCSTAMGSRLLRQWILQPSTDVEVITSRQLVVEAMIECPIMRDGLTQRVLRTLPDIDRVARRLHRKTATLREIAMLRPFVEAVSAAVQMLQLYSGRNKKLLVDEFIVPLEEIAGLMKNLGLLIEATIDITMDREYRINPAFDDELKELEEHLQKYREDIDTEYKSVLRKKGWTEKVCKCELHASYGFILRVSRKEDKLVREDRGLTVVNTSKDGVRFTTAHLNTFSQQHRDQTRLYEARQSDLYKKLVETASSYLPVLDDAKDLLAKLDILSTWATVVLNSRLPMTRPEVLPMEQCVLEVTSVWHPLVEMRTAHCVSNSIRLDKDRSNAAIITGPNMGGKSTFMRSVGVALVLAQIGCYVPCEGMRASAHDAVMCRVGATDCMSHGMSTFMVEMLEASSIVTSTTQNTLVIIDELGRGTSTYDGFGLAWAIASFIGQEKKAHLLFSTHFHELTELACVERANFFNVHFTATTDGGEMQFSYHLVPGACTKSFGIEVAEYARLPPALIADARQRAAELEDFGGEAQALPADVQDELASYATEITAIRGDTNSRELLHAVLNKALKSEKILPLIRN